MGRVLLGAPLIVMGPPATLSWPTIDNFGGRQGQEMDLLPG